MRLNNFITEGIEDKGILKAVFLAGHPGAGKTYTLSKVKSGQIEPRIVNTDKMFPFYKDQWSTEWGKIRDNVKQVTKNQLAGYINSLLPLAIDGTSSNPSNIMRRRGILESFGYDTMMIFVNTSLETAIERASKRERKVDPEVIKRAYDRMQIMKEFYRTKFDYFMEIDNDEGQLTDNVIKKAFNKVSSFYNSGTTSPIGRNIINKLRENKRKYLAPTLYTMDELKNAVGGWYKK
jgi:tRNA uridine 5-carbamoylmethylation protein Kti12